MNHWALFLISIGGVFIMLSSTMESGLGLMILGLLLIAIGIILIYKGKKV